MIKYTHFLCLFFCLLAFTTFAQNKKLVILDQQADQKSFNIINYKGKIIWQLPAGHRPFINQSNSAFGDFIYATFKQFDFAKSPMPVQTKEGIYLLNIKGEKIKDLGQKYSRINPATEGLLRAYEPIEGKRGSSMIIYLDKKGNEVFGGQKYWEATPFSEGYAVVQLENKSGPWQIIDNKGHKVADFPAHLSKSIKTAHPFSDGLTLTLLKRPRGYDRHSFVYQNVYFNTKGEEVLDVYQITGSYENNSPQSFIKGIGVCLRYNKSYFYDNKGNVIPNAESLEGMQAVTEKHIFIRNENRKTLLLDKSFNLVYLPIGKHQKITYTFISDDYIGAWLTDTIAKKSIYHIYDANKLKEVYQTDRMVIGMINNKVLIGKEDGYKTKLIAIENFKNKEIYSLSPENRLFRSVKDALPFKNKVRNLEVSRDKDLEKINAFSNLEVLKINYWTGEELPENLGSLHKLQFLNLYDCDNLTRLPATFSALQNLKELQISGCKKIKGLESLIRQLPKLQRIYTNNYNFNKDFLQQMKTERPHLRIDNWHSSEDIIIEESMIEIPTEEVAPAPAPKKKKN